MSTQSKANLKAGDKVGDGKVVIMKNFAQKGKDSWPNFEREVPGKKSLIDETGKIIDGQRRLKRLDGQQARDRMG